MKIGIARHSFTAATSAGSGIETVNHPADDDGFDLFVPVEELGAADV